MFICVECGKLIEDGDFANWTEPHGEQLCGCPYCYGALEEACECVVCGEYYLEEDLINGICEHCEKNDFDYETALSYLVKTNRIREFFLVWYWRAVDRVNDDENKELDDLLVTVFKAKENEDKITFTNKFYGRLKEYIFDDIYDWTEFLREEVYQG